MIESLTSIYRGFVLRRPKLCLAFVILFVAFFSAFTGDFELDASADSLILENDATLKYYRSIRDKYGSDDYLIVTYSPTNPLFSKETLAQIGSLRDELIALDSVGSVVSLLDVPLLSSPPMTLAEVSRQIRTLDSDDVDIALAETEMRTSPLYENLLVSSDGGTTAMQVNLTENHTLIDLINKRDALYDKRETLPDVQQRLDMLTSKIKVLNLKHKQDRDQVIADVRRIMDKYRSESVLYLGGVPMIVADSIEFIRSDLKVFGVGVVLFIVLILAISFRSVRWVVLPLVACVSSAVVMVGYLGLSHWPVTVVSSNFISLLLIITLSLIIHLIVRYREVSQLQPDWSQFELVDETIKSKFVPCFYTALTTIVAFGSLLASGIRPVIDFGWMMVLGIIISMVLAFTLFPAVLVMLPRLNTETNSDVTGNITASIARFIEHKTATSVLFFLMLIGIAATGLPQLSVENRFIDYYQEDTEIYQGMSLIDEKLGGTTPMDVIIDAPADEILEPDEYAGNEDLTSYSYWFNRDGLLEVAKYHEYLESLPETGKVLSLHTGIKMLETLNEGKPFNDFKLAVVYKRLPVDVKKALFDPYLSKDGNQLRFSIRMYESDKNLKRQALLDKIYTDLTGKFGLDPEQVTLSGMAVLYNNLLQSLFKSQILTIGAVFIAILGMFLLLFRNLKLAMATILPNMIAATFILGLMGWIGIPLDIMTITIAAISIGIGVDDSIHYVHRFREEFAIDQDYWGAVRRCHNSIARALYYTTVTVVLGFSILALSNFIPTIYFGLLSGLAMSAALIANLMLLPILIVKFKLA
ncbi:MAG: putative RND superfamily exporter protein [Gammaproteobacteria bacterium]|jgi:predicted RND superfamily exporter protein